jgi:hypothetical protein
MSAPATPTPEEVSKATFEWEYTYDTIDVSSTEDPPGSRLPLVQVRRRIVGGWEPYIEGDR